MGTLTVMNDPLPPQRGFAVRWVAAIFYAAVLFVAVIVGVIFVQLILAGWWWELPIVAVLAYFTFVLYRRRRERSL